MKVHKNYEQEHGVLRFEFETDGKTLYVWEEKEIVANIAMMDVADLAALGKFLFEVVEMESVK